MGQSFGDNLRAARNALGWSLEKLAAEANTSKGYLSDLERGNRPIPPGSMLDELAGALNLTVAQLVGGSSRAIPLISATAAGQLTSPDTQLPPGEYPTIDIGDLPPGDYFATRIDGNSMDRLSPPGSIIVVNRAERDPVPGRRYIFGRRGETTYKRYEINPLRLEPETTDPERNRIIFPKDEEEWLVIGRVRLTLLNDL